MKKSVLLILFCIIAILHINLANTQNDDKIQFRVAMHAFKSILPQTHAEIILNQSFMDSWDYVQSDDQNPKALTFLYKSQSADKAKLKIIDYFENDPLKVAAEIKESLKATNFTVESDKILTLENKRIYSLFFQDTNQNVRAFYVFKIGNFVFSVEIISKYSVYASVDKYWYEIMKRIKVSETTTIGFDKISLSKSVFVYVPSSMKYKLPARNSVFEGNLDTLYFQGYVYQSNQSVRKLANDIERKFIDRLGFKRLTGEIGTTNEIETVDLYGKYSQNKNLNLFIRAYRNTSIIMIFEYENISKVQKIITEIKQSTTFTQHTEIPDSLIPFAFLIDKNNDSVADYFTINMIFFTKTKKILADEMADSSITIKIYDQNNKIVYKSAPFQISSPKDCLPGGKCSEFFTFNGLWLAKIKDPDYRINVSAMFDNKKLEYKGRLTDLILR